MTLLEQPRPAPLVSRFGDDGEYRVESAKMLGTILHLHRGTPYVYQGEELGMTNMPVTGPNDYRDIQTINFYRDALERGMAGDDLFSQLASGSRDNARRPMQWDSSEHAGFTTGVPWLPANPNASEINAAAALADEFSVLHHYRKLIALRHDHPVVAVGDFAMLIEQDPRVYAFTRSLDDVTLLVLGNFSADEVSVRLPHAAEWAKADLLLGNYPMPEESAAGIVLRPWETRVYRRS